MGKNTKLTIGKFIFIGSLIVLVYAVINSVGGDFALKKNGQCANGVITREPYGGKTKPSLGYTFVVNGKTYDGIVVQDGVLKIGDSVCIVYLPLFPRVNRPFSYFDNGGIRCNCER